MIHLNPAAAAAVLGGALLAPAAPVRADVQTDVAALRTQLEQSNTKLQSIQKQLEQLTELLDGKRDRDGFRIESSPGLVADMKAFKDKLDKLEKDLAALQKTQTALRPATTTPADPKAGKGTVRVVNEYPIPVSILVNGTSYRVGPSKSVDVDVPAGKFTYQLLEAAAAQTESTVEEKKTVVLRIR